MAEVAIGAVAIVHRMPDVEGMASGGLIPNLMGCLLDNVV
jgi:hypothetical protein